MFQLWKKTLGFILRQTLTVSPPSVTGDVEGHNTPEIRRTT